MKAQNFKNVGIAIFGIYTYGWNSPGRESLLDECHQNLRTLGLLTRSVLIEIAWGFLRLVKYCRREDYIKKYL